MKILIILFSNYEWFRKWHGGLWAYVFIKPIYSYVWIKMAENCPKNYTEPSWGSVKFVNYTKQ